MAFSLSVLSLLCIVSFLEVNQVISQELILYRKISLNYTTGYFKSFTNISLDLSGFLGRFPHNTHSDCPSQVECGYRCQTESGCDFFHYDSNLRDCKTVTITGADLRDDGIYACPSPYKYYTDGTIVFCFRVVYTHRTKAQAISSCGTDGGKVAVLIEDFKHSEAAKIGKAVYDSGSKALWIDAMMNTTTKTWYWPDGTRVVESRFNQATSDFHYKPTSKPCVAFLGHRYYLKSYTSTGYVLCEKDEIVKL